MYVNHTDIINISYKNKQVVKIVKKYDINMIKYQD